MRRVLATVATVSVTLSLATCGNDTGSDTEVGGEAQAYAVEQIQARSGASRVAPYRTLDEMLPNVLYEEPGRSPYAVTDLVVVGNVVVVDKGKGFLEGGEDGADSTPTDFDDPDALWRTIHLTVDVETPILPERTDDTITVGLAIGDSSDFDRMSQGLADLGTLMLLLRSGSAVFAYDPSIYAIAEDGSLLATVDSDGRLALPMLDDHDRAQELLEGVGTLDQLQQAAREPARTVPLEERSDVTGG